MKANQKTKKSTTNIISIDLGGWAITKKKGYFHLGMFSHDNTLSVPLYNISELNGIDCWEADEKLTFPEQVQAVVELMEKCSYTDFSIEEFLEKAKVFAVRAKKLGKPIRSYWS